MKKPIVLFLILGLVTLGCVQQPATEYVCSDGSVVSNPSLCPQEGTLTECDGLGDCYDDVVQAAIEERNAELCREMEYNAENCMVEVAVGIPDSKICEELSSDTYRSNCYLEIGAELRDSSYCSKVLEKDYEICVSRTATDLETCNTLEDDNLKINCHAFIADELNDYSPCLELSTCAHTDPETGYCANYALTCCSRLDSDYLRGLCEGAVKSTD